MQRFVALLSGLLFGAGLGVSGMTNPEKVLGFLDVAGAWDPTLAVVMFGAAAIAALGFAVARRMEGPWYAARFQLPTRTELDWRLVGGSTLFGIGWGLVGLCPGPALANLVRGSSQVILFVGSMVLGVLLHHFFSTTPEPAPVADATHS